MSKIQIEEVESLTTNGNLQITPNGTGVLKVSGDTDATLQLDDVKVKAPASSAAQDYTLTLPTTNIAADRFLEVDSITGSGSTAVGQTTFTNIPTPSASPLNGNNFTSGSVPAARYGSLTGTSGAGFKLVQKNILASSVSSILFSNSVLEEDSVYRLIGKSVKVNANTYIKFEFLDSSNNAHTGIRQLGWYERYKHKNTGAGMNQFSTYNGGTVIQSYFIADFCTGVENNDMYNGRFYFYYRDMASDSNGYMGEYYVNFQDYQNQKRVYALRMSPYNSGYTFDVGTELLLYKYQES